jgi:hypothetical protein
MSSMIRQYASRALYPIRETPVAVAGDTLEAAATGAVTGWAEAKGHLDAKFGKHKVPLDALGGVVGSFAGVFLPVPHFLRRAADRLTAIASHRMTKNYVATGKFAGDEISDGLADAGISGEGDPILQAAASL